MSEHTAKPQARAAEKIWGVIEHHGTTGTVSFERRMNTSAEDLWEVVTAPDRLSRWFCAVSGELRLGGRYAADMGTDGLVSGRVLACDPHPGPIG